MFDLGCVWLLCWFGHWLVICCWLFGFLVLWVLFTLCFDYRFWFIWFWILICLVLVCLLFVDICGYRIAWEWWFGLFC